MSKTNLNTMNSGMNHQIAHQKALTAIATGEVSWYDARKGKAKSRKLRKREMIGIARAALVGLLSDRCARAYVNGNNVPVTCTKEFGHEGRCSWEEEDGREIRGHATQNVCLGNGQDVHTFPRERRDG